MSNLISKDEPVQSSAVYTGYIILKAIREKGDSRVSIGEAAKALRAHGILHSRSMMFGMLFLFSTGVIQLDPPYLTCANSESDD